MTALRPQARANAIESNEGPEGKKSGSVQSSRFGRRDGTTEKFRDGSRTNGHHPLIQHFGDEHEDAPDLDSPAQQPDQHGADEESPFEAMNSSAFVKAAGPARALAQTHRCSQPKLRVCLLEPARMHTFTTRPKSRKVPSDVQTQSWPGLKRVRLCG